MTTRCPPSGSVGRSEVPPSPLLLLQVSPSLAGHLATAIRAHRAWAARVPLPAPPELADVERLLAEAARGRQDPTALEDLFELRDRSVVSPLLLTYEQAAEALTLSVRSVQRLVAAGELRAVRIGGACRVRVADLDQYVNALGGN